MSIKKVVIKNYKCFKGKFEVTFEDGINILVGNNEAGKSTILEAINLAMTGIIDGRYLKYELSQYLFNYEIVEEYLQAVKSGQNPAPPDIIIEIFLNKDEYPLFEGNGNSERVNESGIVFKIKFDEQYQAEYEALVSGNRREITTIPIEYYQVDWKSFARESITARSIPIKSVLIDSSATKYRNGSDVYISRIIRNDLEDREKVELSQAHRMMKEAFMENEAVQAINQKIDRKSNLTDKSLSISVDLSTQNSWETTLMTYLDKIPFHQIGKGEQCIIKTTLALAHEKSQEASLILLEEPENHLSHTKLSELIRRVEEGCSDKQVIISTHSSFVANKLGLENLLLLNEQNISRLPDLPPKTFQFFKKLPGYQTLRLLLCHKAILVEGNSDELIFQKAYLDIVDENLPIASGVDVISVGLTFKRFLDIAKRINQQVAVLTDNDGDYEKNIEGKYKPYEQDECITIFADQRDSLNTLEPQFLEANKDNLQNLRVIFGKNESCSDADLLNYMENNKTEWALKVFETDLDVEYPPYIRKAVEWSNE